MKITSAEKCPKCKEAGRTTRLIQDTEKTEVHCKLGHKFAELPSEGEAKAAEAANLPAETAPVDLDRLNAEGGAKLLDVAALPQTLAPPPSTESIPADDRRAPGLVNSIARKVIDQVDEVQKARAAEVAEAMAKEPVQVSDKGHVVLQISIPKDRADELKAYGEQCSPPQTLQERVQSVVEFGLENGWFA